MELNDLQQQRLVKLERLRAAGIDPYPPRAQRTHTIAEVLQSFDDRIARAERVTLAGELLPEAVNERIAACDLLLSASSMESSHGSMFRSTRVTCQSEGRRAATVQRPRGAAG